MLSAPFVLLLLYATSCYLAGLLVGFGAGAAFARAGLRRRGRSVVVRLRRCAAAASRN